jgi:hypothetical protein
MAVWRRLERVLLFVHRAGGGQAPLGL